MVNKSQKRQGRPVGAQLNYTREAAPSFPSKLSPQDRFRYQQLTRQVVAYDGERREAALREMDTLNQRAAHKRLPVKQISGQVSDEVAPVFASKLKGEDRRQYKELMTQVITASGINRQSAIRELNRLRSKAANTRLPVQVVNTQDEGGGRTARRANVRGRISDLEERL